jgi:hypothetical protein
MYTSTQEITATFNFRYSYRSNRIPREETSHGGNFAVEISHAVTARPRARCTHYDARARPRVRSSPMRWRRSSHKMTAHQRAHRAPAATDLCLCLCTGSPPTCAAVQRQVVQTSAARFEQARAPASSTLAVYAWQAASAGRNAPPHQREEAQELRQRRRDTTRRFCQI